MLSSIDQKVVLYLMNFYKVLCIIYEFGMKLSLWMVKLSHRDVRVHNGYSGQVINALVELKVYWLCCQIRSQLSRL